MKIIIMDNQEEILPDSELRSSDMVAVQTANNEYAIVRNVSGEEKVVTQDELFRMIKKIGYKE